MPLGVMSAGLNYVPNTKLLGDSTTGGITDAWNGNTQVYLKFTAIANGPINTLKIKTSVAGNIKLALYNDVSNLPSALLKDFGAFAVNVADTTNLSVPTVNIVSGTVYWLAFKTSVNGTIKGVATGGTNRYANDAYANAWPATASTPSGYSGSYKLAAYT